MPLNLVFGLAAAWAITKFSFRGKSVFISLIDLPFAISPVISDMVFVLMFGMQGWFGPWFVHTTSRFCLQCRDRAGDLFVTFPFVAREVIPLMQEQGSR